MKKIWKNVRAFLLHENICIMQECMNILETCITILSMQKGENTFDTFVTEFEEANIVAEKGSSFLIKRLRCCC